ncbi:hypothetical protein PROFUN_03964 [Planoprotostelium fungivorum]|uniref:Uncharacterized protein n=1 Tax=Planoprotostelium fungivorum TaxID=1890364 RepID=A0A2P6MTU6_9EUKA|nr:hypothetical protein PROFUN_03964 [Planoprotostelium fungivorum]
MTNIVEGVLDFANNRIQEGIRPNIITIRNTGTIARDIKFNDNGATHFWCNDVSGAHWHLFGETVPKASNVFELRDDGVWLVRGEHNERDRFLTGWTRNV